MNTKALNRNNMRRSFFVLLVILLAGEVSGAATEKFSGPYIKGILGYGFGWIDIDVTANGDRDSERITLDGPEFGGVFGYGVVTPSRFYAGFEVEASYSFADGTGSTDSGGVRIDYDFEKDYTIGLYVLPGYLVTENLLIFGRFGWAQTRFDLAMDASGPGGSARVTDSDTEDSFRLGLGADYWVRDNFFFRAEYLWADYGSYSERRDDLRVKVASQDHLLRVGFGGRF